MADASKTPSNYDKKLNIYLKIILNLLSRLANQTIVFAFSVWYVDLKGYKVLKENVWIKLGQTCFFPSPIYYGYYTYWQIVCRLLLKCFSQSK